MYKLLIVDDERMIRMGIEKGIDWKGIGIDEIFSAASAGEALEIIKKKQPQIMLTDIRMTEMTGLDLIDEIRNKMQNDQMRILVLTGFDKFDYARRCLQMRVQNFLLKPVDEGVLRKEVSEQIRFLEKQEKEKEEQNKTLRAEGTRRQNALETYMRALVHRKSLPRDISPDMLYVERQLGMQAAVFVPDVSVHGKGETEAQLRQMNIRNICMGYVDSKGTGFSFADEDGRIVVVFYTEKKSEKDTEIFDQSVTERVQELCRILEDEYDSSPRVALGSEVSGLERLYISYNDAIFLLEQEQKSFGKITKVQKELNREQIILDVYREFKIEFISDISNGERIMHVFGDFKQFVSSYGLSSRQTRRWCFEIYANLYYSYIQETGRKPDHTMDFLLQAIHGAKREETLEITETFLHALVFQENKEQNENIIRARRYIDEHLESDLSVTSLAEKFYISPNYFSKLFKKVIGDSCNEYIVKKRIERSKLLLETTTIKTGKIAMMVGYNDTNYFSLAFKKNVGISPTKYREMTSKGVGISEGKI